jgi:hypothetical protein
LAKPKGLKVIHALAFWCNWHGQVEFHLLSFSGVFFRELKKLKCDSGIVLRWLATNFTCCLCNSDKHHCVLVTGRQHGVAFVELSCVETQEAKIDHIVHLPDHLEDW